MRVKMPDGAVYEYKTITLSAYYTFIDSLKRAYAEYATKTGQSKDITDEDIDAFVKQGTYRALFTVTDWQNILPPCFHLVSKPDGYASPTLPVEGFDLIDFDVEVIKKNLEKKFSTQDFPTDYIGLLLKNYKNLLNGIIKSANQQENQDGSPIESTAKIGETHNVKSGERKK